MPAPGFDLRLLAAHLALLLFDRAHDHIAAVIALFQVDAQFAGDIVFHLPQNLKRLRSQVRINIGYHTP